LKIDDGHIASLWVRP